MTKNEAHRKATALWGTGGTKSGDRYAVVSLRRKSVHNRCVVGYHTRRADGTVDVTFMGEGPTWEAAFESATKPDKELEVALANPIACECPTTPRGDRVRTPNGHGMCLWCGLRIACEPCSGTGCVIDPAVDPNKVQTEGDLLKNCPDCTPAKPEMP